MKTVLYIPLYYQMLFSYSFMCGCAAQHTNSTSSVQKVCLEKHQIMKRTHLNATEQKKNLNHQFLLKYIHCSNNKKTIITPCTDNSKQAGLASPIGHMTLTLQQWWKHLLKYCTSIKIWGTCTYKYFNFMQLYISTSLTNYLTNLYVT